MTLPGLAFGHQRSTFDSESSLWALLADAMDDNYSFLFVEFGSRMMPRHSWTQWCTSAILFGILGWITGCSGTGPRLDQALLSDRNPAAHSNDLDRSYIVHPPDLLEVQVSDPGGWMFTCAVRPDGRVDLGEAGLVRVDGLTTRDIAYAVSRQLSLPASRVRVRVAEYNSQQLFLYGEVMGLQRVVPYQGPETVVDLLQRVGGITPGAAPAEIYVVRSRVADGKAPEVFQVDLEAILLKKDLQSNVLLQPFDQVYIGQSRKGLMHHCLPPWSRPLYEELSGMKRK